MGLCEHKPHPARDKLSEPDARLFHFVELADKTIKSNLEGLEFKSETALEGSAYTEAIDGVRDLNKAGPPNVPVAHSRKRQAHKPLEGGKKPSRNKEETPEWLKAFKKDGLQYFQTQRKACDELSSSCKELLLGMDLYPALVDGRLLLQAYKQELQGALEVLDKALNESAQWKQSTGEKPADETQAKNWTEEFQIVADDLKAHKNAFNNVMGKKMKEVKDILEEHKRTARIP